MPTINNSTKAKPEQYITLIQKYRWQMNRNSPTYLFTPYAEGILNKDMKHTYFTLIEYSQPNSKMESLSNHYRFATIKNDVFIDFYNINYKILSIEYNDIAAITQRNLSHHHHHIPNVFAIIPYRIKSCLVY
jgi:hypothetical protein